MSSQQNRIMKLTGIVFKDFWKSHIRMLGMLVQGLLLSRQAGIAAIGRHLPTSVSPKHNIKRVDYFLGRSKVDVLDSAQALAHWLVGNRQEVYISVDWTKVKAWSVLVATIVYRGRSFPIFWAAMDHCRVSKSWNHFEHTFFQLLKIHVLPKNRHYIVIADRGFKRIRLMQQLHDLGFSYVVRTGGNTYVNHPKYKGTMKVGIRTMLITKKQNNSHVKSRP